MITYLIVVGPKNVFSVVTKALSEEWKSKDEEFRRNYSGALASGQDRSARSEDESGHIELDTTFSPLSNLDRRRKVPLLKKLTALVIHHPSELTFCAV